MGSEPDPIYGDLPAGWQLTSIAHLIEEGEANVQTGPFGTMLHASSYRETGTPVVAVKNIAANRLSYAEIPRVDDETYARLARYQIQEGDILFGRKGAVERRAYVHRVEDGWLQGSDCIRVRMRGLKAQSRFVSFVLGTPQYRSWIIQNAHGATMPSLNQEIVGRIPLPLPPIAEQKAIACILGTLDDKIELNRHMNETLEGIARAIFKSWFVDFDPVRAKGAGRQPPGLAPHIADLFPDAFEESELGEIPKGWKVAVLADAAEIVDCLHGKKPEQQEKGKLFLQVYNVGRAGNLDLSKPYYISEEDYKTWTSRIEIKPGDLVITKTGRVGAIAQIPSDVNAAIGRNIVGIRAKTCAMQPGFLRDCMLSNHMRREIHLQTSSGTILQSLHVKSISKLRLSLPPLPLVQKYDEIVEGIHGRLELNDAESRNLTALRDTLLPKLISGELRVSEVERIVERCV